eukprot:2888199-Rhodomonas_salina.2
MQWTASGLQSLAGTPTISKLLYAISGCDIIRVTGGGDGPRRCYQAKERLHELDSKDELNDAGFLILANEQIAPLFHCPCSERPSAGQSATRSLHLVPGTFSYPLAALPEGIGRMDGWMAGKPRKISHWRADIEGAVPADVLNEELELKGWPRKRKEYARLLALSPARTYKKGWTG